MAARAAGALDSNNPLRGFEFQKIGPDSVDKIFSYLLPHEVLNSALVSKYWNGQTDFRNKRVDALKSVTEEMKYHPELAKVFRRLGFPISLMPELDFGKRIAGGGGGGDEVGRNINLDNPRSITSLLTSEHFTKPFMRFTDDNGREAIAIYFQKKMEDSENDDLADEMKSSEESFRIIWVAYKDNSEPYVKFSGSLYIRAGESNVTFGSSGGNATFSGFESLLRSVNSNYSLSLNPEKLSENEEKRESWSKSCTAVVGVVAYAVMALFAKAYLFHSK